MADPVQSLGSHGAESMDEAVHDGIGVLMVLGGIEHGLQHQRHLQHPYMLVLKLLDLPLEQEQVIQVLLPAHCLYSEFLTMHGGILFSDASPIETKGCFWFAFGKGGAFDEFHQVIFKVLLLLQDRPLGSDLVLIEVVLPRDPPELVLLQHPPQHHLGHSTHIGLLGEGNRQSSLFETIAVQHLSNIAVAIRTVPEQHLVQDYPTRPNIGLAAIDLLVEHLRGHVERRPKGSLREIISSSESLAKTEISQFEMSRFKEDVVRFDVPVQDEVLTQGTHGQYKLSEDDQCLALWKPVALADEGLEGASLAILIDEVDVVIGLDHLHELHHVQVALQQTQSVYLVASQLGQLPHLHKLVQRHHLHSYLNPGIHVEGSKDLAVLALAQVLGEGVVVDDFDHGSYELWFNVISIEQHRMIQLAFLLALLALILLVQATHTDPELPAPDLPSLPPSMRYYIFTQHCYETLFVQGDFLNFECIKRSLVKFMGYGVILGGAIVKVPQILKIVKKKSTFGVSFPSVVLEVFTQLSAVAYNIYRQNPFSVYGETLFIGIQCILILVLFILYGESNRRTLYLLTLIPVAAVFYAAINPSYFPKYIIDNAMVAQIILFSGARLLQIFEIHRVKSTGSLSEISCTMNVLGNLSRLATALVEVADDMLYRMSFIVAFILNAYILLCFIIFRNPTKPEEKKQ